MFKAMPTNTSSATSSSPALDATITRPNLNAASPFSASPQPLNSSEIAYLHNLSIPDSRTPSPYAPKKLSIASADLAEGEIFKFGANVTSTSTPSTDTNAQAFVPRFPEPRCEQKLSSGNKRAKQLELLITIWEEREEEPEAGGRGRLGRGLHRRHERDGRRRSGSGERGRRGGSRWERRGRVISVAT